MPTQFTLPPDTRSVGTPDPAGDMNNVIDALKAQGAVYNVLNATYGTCDPTGANDCTTAIQNAVSSMPASGGVIYFPPGTYRVNSTITCTQAGVYFQGASKHASVIMYYGSGDCIRMYSTTLTTPNGVYGGGVKGLMIDGSNAAAGACGLHFGDIFRPEFDVGVRDFQGTGSKGVWFDNNYHWTEQITGQVFAEQCTSHVVFDNSANTSGVATGSFARALLDITLDTKGKGDGVVLQGGAVLYDHRVGIYGNMDYSPSTQRWALTVTGSTGGQFSRMQAGVLNIGMEINGTSGTQPGTITFGTAGSNYIRACTGVIDFGAASAFAGANNWDGSFQFDGPVLGDAHLLRSAGTATAHFSSGAITNGGFLTTRFDSVITASPSGNVTGIVLGTGDPGLSGTAWADQTVTVVNQGTGSITFDVPGTSHVATGTACVIPAGQSMTFIWISNSSTWYPAQGILASLAAEPPFLPSDVGWLAWTYDPTGIVNNSTITTGQLVLIRVNVRAAISCTNVVIVVNVAGNTLTSGQNFVGLYNSSGTKIGGSADQTSAWGGTGLMTAALTGGPFTLAPGFYWVALVSNGTTSPSFGRNVNNAAALVNGTNNAANSRYGGILSGQTSLPTSITPSGITQQGVGFWAALS